MQKLNHAIPTVGLIFSGLQALQHGARGFELALAIVEIVTSAFLIVSVVQGLRAAPSAAVASHGAHNLLDIENAAEVADALREARRRVEAAPGPTSC